MTNRFRRFSENSRGGFSGNRSTLLRPSFFSERSFTRFWRLGFARSLTDQQSYEAIEYLLHAADGPPDFGKKHDKLLFRAQFFYFMGEVEAVFGIWLIPLFVASQLAKPGRSINPRFSIWRGRNFAAVPFPWSPGADAYRRSSVYVASLRGQLDKSRALGVTVCEQRLATKRDHPAGRPVAQ